MHTRALDSSFCSAHFFFFFTHWTSKCPSHRKKSGLVYGNFCTFRIFLLSFNLFFSFVSQLCFIRPAFSFFFRAFCNFLIMKHWHTSTQNLDSKSFACFFFFMRPLHKMHTQWVYNYVHTTPSNRSTQRVLALNMYTHDAAKHTKVRTKKKNQHKTHTLEIGVCLIGAWWKLRWFLLGLCRFSIHGLFRRFSFFLMCCSSIWLLVYFFNFHYRRNSIDWSRSI